MIASLVFTIIKYGVGSGAVSLTELRNSSKMTRCSLTGNSCTPICPKLDKHCTSKIFEHNYLTIGQLYVITKIIRTKEIEDKDFFLRVMANKSYIELFDDPEKAIYEPIKDIGIETLKFMKGERTQQDIVYTKKRKNNSINNNSTDENIDIIKNRQTYLEIITRVEKPKLDAAYENLHASIIKTVGTLSGVSSQTLQILNNYKNPITTTFFDMHTLINKVISYVKEETIDYNEKDMYTILEYMIVGYKIKNNNDFPKIDLNNQKMSQLVLQTADLEDASINKWTSARKNKILNLDNPYHVFLFGNNYMNLWQKSCIEHVPLTKITEFDIRLKHILDVVLTSIAYIYATDKIIFNFDSSKISRAIYIFKSIRNIHNIYKDMFGITNYFDFFFKEQTSQYNVSKTIDKDMLQHIRDKYNVIQITEVHQSYDTFKELDLLTNVSIIDTPI